jgi:hypothetical protein
VQHNRRPRESGSDLDTINRSDLFERHDGLQMQSLDDSLGFSEAMEHWINLIFPLRISNIKPLILISRSLFPCLVHQDIAEITNDHRSTFSSRVFDPPRR